MIPKISIITITYNSAATVEDTILSVLNQTHSNIEYIVVDGASKDNTMAIVNGFKDKISKIISEPDKGIYDAMNKGVALATGEIIGILNSDDVYADNNVVSDMIKAMADADSCYADLVYVAQDNLNKVVRYWKSGKMTKNAFRMGWMPPHPTFFVRKAVYESFGGFNLELRSAADYEFMLRVLYRYKISTNYLPRVITKMRVGGESNVTLKNRLKANNEDAKAWAINDLKPLWFTIKLKPLRKIPQFFLRKKI